MSYEKLLYFPEREIKELAQFMNFPISNDHLERLSKEIKPERGHPPM